MLLQGLDQLRAKLESMAGGTAKRAGKAGLNAGLGVIAAEMRSRVNGLPISPELKAAARGTIAKRLLKKEGQELVGKAGFGVGHVARDEAKWTKKQRAAHARYLAGQGGQHLARGVGASASDIHWFALGTHDRYTGSQTATDRKGRGVKLPTGNAAHYTGRLPPSLGDVIADAAAAAEPAAMQACAVKIREVLEREAAART